MGATFSRIKSWISGDTLTHTDLNAEFNNILTNFTPAGMDDQSTNDAAMQSTVDPYPSSVIDKPTDLKGEIERLRYVIKQITGEAQWYVDPDATIAAINSSITTTSVIVDIGDWNMTNDATVTVAHGLTFSNIRGINVIIRNDANDTYYNLIESKAEVTTAPISFDATNVTLRRTASGSFTSGFSTTSYNRGWITITYLA